jgi:hypothetical protein
MLLPRTAAVSLLGALVALGGAAGCGLDANGTATVRGSGAGGTLAGTSTGNAATTAGSGGAATGGAGGATPTGTGTGSTTSSTSSSSSTSGTTTSSATGKTEDCFNGKDDDGNGKIDCEDDACAASAECIDAPPAGWNGLARFGSAAYPDPAAAACPDGAQPSVLFAGPADAPTCAACSCTFTDASCTAPEISCWYYQISCWFGPSFVIEAPSSACVGNLSVPQIGYALSSCSLTGDAKLVDPGTCAAKGGGLAQPAPWAETLHVCPIAKTGGGCGKGRVCAPKPSAAPYGGPLCVLKPGTDDCPAGFDASSVQAYDHGDDTRACSGCSCDTAGVTCKGGSYEVINDKACGGSGKVVDGGGCTDTSGNLDNDSGSLRPTPATPTAGTCSGGAASGKLSPKGPQKLCCRAPG